MSERTRKCAFLSLFVLFFVAATAALAQVRVEDIVNKPDEYKHKEVTIQGTVVLKTPEEEGRAVFYVIRDDYGGVIDVRTSDELPTPGERFEVRGIVTSDPALEIFIDERSRTSLAKDSEPAPAQQGPPWWLWTLIVAIVVVFVVLIVLLIILLVGRKRPGAAVEGPAGAGELPSPSKELKGKTIKLHSPPPGTMKLLPGYLEVVSGEEKVKEVRFFMPKGQLDYEFTFGRDEGPPYSHIQLEHGTVSSRQAKLIYADNAFRLINYSTTNPTKVSDKNLGENESAKLQDGDTIEMGIVKFVYHAS